MERVAGEEINIDLDKLKDIHFLYAQQGDAVFSRWGHSMFRLTTCKNTDNIDEYGKDCDASGELVTNYLAAVDISNFSIWEALKGMMGYYGSQTSIENFYDVKERYLILEDRILNSIPLKFSKEEIKNFVYKNIQDAWASIDSDYYFVGNNCAHKALNAFLSTVADRKELSRDFLGKAGYIEKAKIMTPNYVLNFLLDEFKKDRSLYDIPNAELLKKYENYYRFDMEKSFVERFPFPGFKASFSKRPGASKEFPEITVENLKKMSLAENLKFYSTVLNIEENRKVGSVIANGKRLTQEQKLETVRVRESHVIITAQLIMQKKKLEEIEEYYNELKELLENGEWKKIPEIVTLQKQYPEISNGEDFLKTVINGIQYFVKERLNDFVPYGNPSIREQQFILKAYEDYNRKYQPLSDALNNYMSQKRIETLQSLGKDTSQIRRERIYLEDLVEAKRCKHLKHKPEKDRLKVCQEGIQVLIRMDLCHQYPDLRICSEFDMEKSYIEKQILPEIIKTFKKYPNQLLDYPELTAENLERRFTQQLGAVTGYPKLTVENLKEWSDEERLALYSALIRLLEEDGAVEKKLRKENVNLMKNKIISLETFLKERSYSEPFVKNLSILLDQNQWQNIPELTNDILNYLKR